MGTETLASALRILHATTGDLREVLVADIRALPYLSAAELDARLDHQRTIDPDAWSSAENFTNPPFRTRPSEYRRQWWIDVQGISATET
jgi:hypothetical protein